MTSPPRSKVWPSGHAQNVVDFIDNPDGNVANAGLLGPVGKIGWYMPTYMVDQHPELATWEGFMDPELAKLFATAETGDNGQFLGGDPSFVQYDEAIIENLGMPMEVVYAGSEQAILASLDAAYNREEPILIYLWTPHCGAQQIRPHRSGTARLHATSATRRPRTTASIVRLPGRRVVQDRVEGSGRIDPPAVNVVPNMNYTTADQVEMLASVETDGMSVEDAARGLDRRPRGHVEGVAGLNQAR